MNLTVRIIRPAGREDSEILTNKISSLENYGVRVLYDDPPFDELWPFTSSSPESRKRQLENALFEDGSDVIWCARGGYGSSDILPLLSWNKIKKNAPFKPIVGFSDISALHSAFYTVLSWKGLHAPMPATVYWEMNGNEDVIETLRVLQELKDKGYKNVSSAIPVAAVNDVPSHLEGELFGGCISVLCNLIGTEYFPKSFKDKILFFEDTYETGAKIMRFVNQWLQLGLFNGVKGIVLGEFSHCLKEGHNIDQHIYRQFALRTKLPIYKCRLFGHASPNFPLMVGSQATLASETLSWEV